MAIDVPYPDMDTPSPANPWCKKRIKPAKAMRVLVTGANGLLGTHVIQQLLEKGYAVNGLLRNKDKFLLPEYINLELIEGDLRNQTIVNKAVKGCDAIIHCAAITAQN